MKTYLFRVVVEPDEDRWVAHCPALEKYGGATWGYTAEEAMKNIQEVLQMVLEDMAELNEPIPEGPEGEIFVSPEPRVAVTI